VLDVPLSLAVGWRPGAAHLVAVGSAWLYDLRLKQTLVSWLPYAVSFGLLPVIIATALPGHPRPQAVVVAAGSCLGIGAHFANTVGDAADDARTGVRGLPQRLGPRWSIVIAAVFVAAAAGLLVIATSGAVVSITAAAVAVAAVPVVATGSTRQAPFAAVILSTATLIVAFVVAGGHHLTAA
jgi:4-hydroxybenzoate polyprenyltransferase